MSAGTSVRSWARDLTLGVRFAVTGGREGWVRLVLTAVGVGLGVALLLLTTALPNALAERHRREAARLDHTYSEHIQPKADNTLLIADVDSTFRDKNVLGRLVEPEGPDAPLAPGVTRYPGPGEMVVSPALKRLLESDDAELLRERLPYRVVGTIGEQGLIGSKELAYYAGARGLEAHIDGWRVARITEFGPKEQTEETWDPVLLLLVLVMFVVLLTPVVVFIATAVRFGGERRDRRLAALRLVGADRHMTRRIAAGEALAGSLLGLVAGALLFLVGRQVAGGVEVADVSVFPDYLDPSPGLVALVAVAVPVTSVLVTLMAMRGVVIEPLGVVRTTKPARRRLWWRLLMPVVGLALLLPMVGQGRDHGGFNRVMVIGGVLLLLIGVTALLPWVVETVVARLGRGPVSWQLAVRRLQLSSGSAARMVNGIAVAVAGAIALQMLFSGVQGDYRQATGKDLDLAQMRVRVSGDVPLQKATAEFDATRGVDKVLAFGQTVVADTHWKDNGDPDHSADLTVGTCAALREVAKLPSCHDGDVFVATGGHWDTDPAQLVVPGRRLYVRDANFSLVTREVAWTVPQGLKKAVAIKAPDGWEHAGVLITPGALPKVLDGVTVGQVFLSVDESVPDSFDRVRTTAARLDRFSVAEVWRSHQESREFHAIRTGLLVGAVCVLVLIGASLLVSQLEQLRERRKLLSTLVAFGTRRSTLSLSVLWQTAVPIALGLLLAMAVGLGLGVVLLKMTATPVHVDWASALTMTGIGASVVVAVTLLSLPPLLRLMRPDGLRTE
ncbi:MULTISPECIES: ABC transporter permease [Streptomyces]|uniref:FtsX-like permease family protein n=1 Tax=Streptomyces thermoviolaceus subsp. thermoviolaceus TaxID=66860 RepID=A0ABX0YY49_STRTL|nr:MULTISPECIES: FtsX-like permease family protein [Streptomyces]MCM3262867.1 FtsX-like permease family protein [Streptomyces thermoviolaceus]NJP15935.1 FtsX-like permease family protein [Streptomyces thermoviolaceus subsp. thermoviolaceus]RSR95650.1 ABC transporter permease [Streptomyces sp. WAC00469]WTD47651.1 FtsX-like permease family protein [Streptomyces thermoviolaceus]GGV79856.1 membrane protein [Streptomyces thermoviolaceus subsp. apingens]